MALRTGFFPKVVLIFALATGCAPASSIQSILNIGTLASSVDQFGDESAIFTLFPAFRPLLSDSAGTQFRFFQVIYYDDEPVTYNGNIITPASTSPHLGTVVDTPAGGWDYELPGGDDLAPFYESDTENNPATGQPYAFPTLSYPDLHSPDGVNPGSVSTSDAPGLNDANHRTLFETYVAYDDPAMRAGHIFDVLGGFSWGVQTDALGNESGIATSGIGFTSIDSAKVTELQQALNRSGFTGANAWTVESVDIFAPEPSTILIVGLGLAFFGFRRFC